VIARFGQFTLDTDQRRLFRGEADVHLTPKAFDLLVLLIDEAPHVVRKGALHQRLWQDTFVFGCHSGAHAAGGPGEREQDQRE
jgi:DNA-binding winged helix-turn-helix (wHTH) protein